MSLKTPYIVVPHTPENTVAAPGNLLRRRTFLKATLALAGATVAGCMPSVEYPMNFPQNLSARAAETVVPMNPSAPTLNSETAPAPASPPEAPAERMVPFAEWFNKISLPQITLDEQGAGWGHDRARDYFLPKEADPRLPAAIAKHFENFEKNLFRELAKTRDPEARKQILAEKFNDFAKPLRDLKEIQSLIDLSGNNPRTLIDAINIFLVPEGHWIGFKAQPFAMSFFDVRSLKSVAIAGDSGASFEVPAAVLGRERRVAGGEWDMYDGQYLPHSPHYIILNSDRHEKYLRATMETLRRVCATTDHCLPKTFDTRHLTRDMIAQKQAAHEGGHAHYFQELDLGTGNIQTNLKHRGPVDMESYTLAESDYATVTNQSLHELYAHGSEIRQSPELGAAIVLGILLNPEFSQNSGYDFTKRVLLMEMAHSPYLKEIPDGASQRALIAVVSKIPASEFTRIGTRMAKLAVRLTQRS